MYGVESLAEAKQTKDRIPISSVEPDWPLSCKVSTGLPCRTTSPGLKQPHGLPCNHGAPFELPTFQSKF